MTSHLSPRRLNISFSYLLNMHSISLFILCGILKIWKMCTVFFQLDLGRKKLMRCQKQIRFSSVI